MSHMLGIREFRDNFTRIAREGGDPVVVKNHKQVVGWYVPVKRPTPEAIERTITGLEAVQAEWRAQGRDLDADLASLGMDPYGNPLDTEC